MYHESGKQIQAFFESSLTYSRVVPTFLPSAGGPAIPKKIELAIHEIKTKNLQRITLFLPSMWKAIRPNLTGVPGVVAAAACSASTRV